MKLIETVKINYAEIDQLNTSYNKRKGGIENRPTPQEHLANNLKTGMKQEACFFSSMPASIYEQIALGEYIAKQKLSITSITANIFDNPGKPFHSEFNIELTNGETINITSDQL